MDTSKKITKALATTLAKDVLDFKLANIAHNTSLLHTALTELESTKKDSLDALKYKVKHAKNKRDKYMMFNIAAFSLHMKDIDIVAIRKKLFALEKEKENALNADITTERSFVLSKNKASESIPYIIHCTELEACFISKEKIKDIADITRIEALAHEKQCITSNEFLNTNWSAVEISATDINTGY